MWGAILKAALPLMTGMFAGKKNKKAAAASSQGARLQDVLPLLMPLIQQQQQHSQQNYQQQQDRYAQSLPLQDAIARLAGSLSPRDRM